MKKMHRRILAISLALLLAMGLLLGLNHPSPRTIPLQAHPPITHITVEKQRHILTLFAQDRAVHTYPVSLGRGGLEPKRYEGDKRTPEGSYIVDTRNENSSYHRSLRISYPGPKDIKEAAKTGKDPGGEIMIHGIKNGLGWIGSLHRVYDWTAGCIAVTDEEIEEIWQLVADGTPIDIKP